MAANAVSTNRTEEKKRPPKIKPRRNDDECALPTAAAAVVAAVETELTVLSIGRDDDWSRSRRFVG